MYDVFLPLHSVFRWVVLLSLLYGIIRAYRGYSSGKPFTRADNAVRHWTATIAHIQLILGFTLYFISPLTKTFMANARHAGGQQLFFGLVHLLLMLTAIVLITVGSALAKRSFTDSAKFRTMLIWFSLGLLVIFIAIPWPFSPLANRPYIRF